MLKFNSKKLFYYIPIIVGVFIIFIYRKKIKSIILPFFIGGIIAYILNPVVDYLGKKGLHRTVAISIIYFILIGYSIVTLFYIIPVMINEINKIVELLPIYSKIVDNFINTIRVSLGDSIPSNIKSTIEGQIFKLESGLALFLQNTVNLLIHGISSFFSSIILGPIIGFYLLKDFKKIKKNIEDILPEKYRLLIFPFLNKIDFALGKYIRGQLIVCFFIGVLTTLILYIFKIEFALLIGILAGVTNIIPYFGPIIGALPAVIIALMKCPQKIPWVLLSLFIIQQVESGIISPWIMGENLNLHPLTVIFSLMVGGTFFGIWGLILSIPMAAVLKLLINSYNKKFY
ncbi:AI-2E family transporter [Thermovenabulum gondwanense]|uniref:AI-2E family transporter n=1 Tax=Thermovenabulum gondwanense TaxID=520767 RepID=UPI0009FC529C